MAVTVEKLVAEVQANTGKASTELAAIHQLLTELSRTRHGKVKIDVDSSQVDKATTKTKALKTEMVGLQGVGQRIQGLKFSGQGLALTLGLPTALSAIAPLISGLNALAGGAVGLSAPLADSLTIIGGAPAVVTPAIAAFGAFKLSTLGVSDALKETAKASEKLSEAKLGGDPEEIRKAREEYDQVAKSISANLAPSAVRFVKIIDELRSGVKVAGKDLQQSLFEGANVGMTRLVGSLSGYLPQLNRISGEMGRTFSDVARSLTSDETTGKVNLLLNQSTGLFSTLSSVVSGFTGVFTDLGVAAIPVLSKMEGALARTAAAAKLWSTTKLWDGSLTAQFDRAWESLRKLWVIIRNVGSALGSTVAAFRPMGEWLLDNIERLTLSWATWSKSISGQNALKRWSEESKPILEELGLLVRDFSKVWSNVGEPEGMVTVIRLIREDFLPALQEVITTSGQTGIFESVVAGLGDLVRIISTLMGTSGVFKIMIDGFVALADVVTNLISAFPWLGDQIANIATAFGLLKIIGVRGPIGLGFVALLELTDNLAGSLEPLIPVVLGFGAAWAAVNMGRLASEFTSMTNAASVGLQKLLSTNGLAALGDAFGNAGGGLSGMRAMLGAVTPGMLAMGAAVGGVAIAVGTAGYAWLKYRQQLAEIAKAQSDFTATINSGKDVLDAQIQSLTKFAEEGRGAGEFQVLGTDIKGVSKILSENAGLMDQVRAGYLEGGKSVDALRDSFESLNAVQLGGGDPAALSRMRELVDLLAGVDDSGLREQLLKDLALQDKLNTAAGRSLSNQASSALQAAAAHKVFLTEQQKQNLSTVVSSNSLSEQQKILGQVAVSMGDAANKAGIFIDTGPALQELANKQATAWDAAKSKIDTYYSFLGVVAGRNDAIKAQDDLLAKLRDTEAALKENKGSFDASTNAGKANRDVIRELYQSYLDQAASAVKSGTSIQEASGKYGEFTARLEELRQKGLLGNETVQTLTESLGLAAQDWNASFSLSIKDVQLLRLQQIESLLRGMDDHGIYSAAVDAIIAGQPDRVQELVDDAKWLKDHPKVGADVNITETRKRIENVVVTGDGSWKSIVSAFGFGKADGGLVDYFANGGMRENHTAQIAPAGAWRVWAEPETGGEAYIPLAPQKRSRSIAIWEETGRRLGTYFADGGINGKTLSKFHWPGLDYQSANRTLPDVHHTIKLDGGDLITKLSKTGSMIGAAVSGAIAKVGNSALIAAWRGKPGSAEHAIIPYGKSTGVPMSASSVYRNSIVHGSTRLSLHASHRAVDFVAPGGGVDTPGLLAIERAFLPVKSMLAELIYSGPGSSSIPSNPITRADHHNHVHVALKKGGIFPMAKGGIVTSPTLALLGEGDRPEGVFPLQRFASGGITTKGAFAGQQLANLTQNSGFQSEFLWGQAFEAMSNAWEQTVAKLEKTDPAQAIATIQERISREGIAMWSDTWVQMTNRIESLQAEIVAKEESKKRNKWEYDFDHATTEMQLQMAQAAAGTLEAWTDDWVSMTRRVEEAQKQLAAEHPTVYIAEAVFNDGVDVDTFAAGVEWRTRVSRY